MRAATGVSWGSGLTGRRQGEPPDEEEDPPVSMRLGVQELPRRREKEGGGVLEARRVAALDVLEDGLQRAPGHAPPPTPTDGVEPAGGLDAVGSLELLGVTAAEVGLPERAVGDVPWPLPRRTRQGRADACDLRTPRRAGGYRGHRHAARADPPRPGHPHVRRDRVLGLEEEPSFVLVKVATAEEIGRASCRERV